MTGTINNDISELINNLASEEFSTVSANKCLPFDLTNIESFLSKNSKKMSILNLNIRSLPKNYDRLVLFLNKLKFNFKIIILTETWLSQTNKDDYPLSGYSCSHSVRDTRGGGVSIYYHEEFDCIPLTSLSLVHDFVETNFIQISHSSFIEPLTIGGIYRPPGMKSIDEFHAKIDNILNCKEISGRNIILGGDFNINLLNLHDQKNLDFINLMKSNYFCPLITTPTRVTTNEKNNLKSTLIDHL